MYLWNVSISTNLFTYQQCPSELVWIDMSALSIRGESKMDKNLQREKAEAFRRMHDRKRILVLPNAWDAASARVFEAAGFKAVATTSAGVAYTLGYPDGEIVPLDMMVAAVAR